MKMRTRALDRGRVPDELDRLLRVTPPSLWISVIALAVSVAAFAWWGLEGHLTRSINAQGVLASALPPYDVQSTQSGQVDSVLVAPGSTVAAGAPVVTLAAEANRPEQTLYAPAAGVVSNISVAPGQVIGAGSGLYTLQPIRRPDQPLNALLFLPRKQGAIIVKGMKTNLSVDSAPSGGFGVLRGVVESVTAYPLSEQALTSLLGNADLAQTYEQIGPPLLARVRLVGDRATRSGLTWSTRKGPPFALRPGTGVSGDIVEQTQSPFQVLFGS